MAKPKFVSPAQLAREFRLSRDRVKTALRKSGIAPAYKKPYARGWELFYDATAAFALFTAQEPEQEPEQEQELSSAPKAPQDDLIVEVRRTNDLLQQLLDVWRVAA